MLGIQVLGLTTFTTSGDSHKWSWVGHWLRDSECRAVWLGPSESSYSHHSQTLGSAQPVYLRKGLGVQSQPRFTQQPAVRSRAASLLQPQGGRVGACSLGQRTRRWRERAELVLPSRQKSLPIRKAWLSTCQIFTHRICHFCLRRSKQWGAERGGTSRSCTSPPVKTALKCWCQLPPPWAKMELRETRNTNTPPFQ